MLRGRYGDTSGRPYIAGRVVLPRLDLTVDVSFCLDTGADRTMLMPSDYLRVALDVTALRDAVETIGVGGASLAYREPALVAFASRDQVFVYRIVVEIASYAPDIADVPSLLGRDILNRWRVNYHPTKGRLWCYPVDTDVVLDV